MLFVLAKNELCVCVKTVKRCFITFVFLMIGYEIVASYFRKDNTIPYVIIRSLNMTLTVVPVDTL